MVLLSRHRERERESKRMTASVVKCEPRLGAIDFPFSPKSCPSEKEQSWAHKRHEYSLLLPLTQLTIKRRKFSKSVYNRLSNYKAIHTRWIQFNKARKWIGQLYPLQYFSEELPQNGSKNRERFARTVLSSILMGIPGHKQQPVASIYFSKGLEEAFKWFLNAEINKGAWDRSLQDL